MSEECTHNHDHKLPTLMKPTADRAFVTTTLVMQMSNMGGLDKPISKFESEMLGQPLRETGVSILTVVYVDPYDQSPLASFTMDIPHVMPGMPVGGSAVSLPAELWELVSMTSVSTAIERAAVEASETLMRQLAGQGLTQDQYSEWLEKNIPLADCTDPNTGTELMLKMKHSLAKGETTFMATDYGSCVKHVTNEGWDDYMGWLKQHKGVSEETDLAFEVQMDSVPEYILATFGVKP